MITRGKTRPAPKGAGRPAPVAYPQSDFEKLGIGARYYAQRAAIEKRRCIYYELVCGHFCPQEVHELYRIMGPATQAMCERCGDFKDIKPVMKRESTIMNDPEELPF